MKYGIILEGIRLTANKIFTLQKKTVRITAEVKPGNHAEKSVQKTHILPLSHADIIQ
jgi:hypothetical protein